MIISADDVRTHLGGLAQYVDALGPELAARAYAERIAAAEAWFQRTTRVRLAPTHIVTYPEEGQEYDIADDAYTLHGASSTRPIRVQLRWRPIIEMIQMTLEFHRGAEIIRFPASWERMNKRLGIVTIIPFGAAAPAVAAAGATMWLPVLGRSMWPQDTIPQLLAVDYRAGLENADTDPELADVRDCLGRAAAWRLIQDIPRLVPDSVTLDGFTQSFSRIHEMVEDLQTSVNTFVELYQGRERPMVVGIL
jgi:hypothetical protein